MRSRRAWSSPTTARSSSRPPRPCCSPRVTERPMSTALVTDLTIFVLALLVGVEVIGKVPATLHTPLMSAANSIHGIVLAGALLIGVTADNTVGYILAFVAAFFAAANVVGGYVVTGRMLKMFRRKGPAPGPPAAASASAAVADGDRPAANGRPA